MITPYGVTLDFRKLDYGCMYATENWLDLPCGAVAEWLRHRSCDQKVPSSIPVSGISVGVTSQC